jgi:two-component system response regulator TctD
MSVILVVEDDKEIGEAVVDALQEAGYEVMHVTDGNKVFEVLEAQTVGLIYLDIMMPGIDGYEVLRRLKQQGSAYFDIPVVILSNLGQMQEIERAMGIGARDYLIKANVDLKKILEVTKKYMR